MINRLIKFIVSSPYARAFPKKETLKISSNVFGDSNDENKFPHKILLTNTVKFQGFIELLQIIPQLI